MLSILDNCNSRSLLIEHEDVFYAYAFYSMPGRYRLPTLDQAKAFAVEQLYHHDPIAMHSAWKHLAEDKMIDLLGDLQ